MATDFRYRLDTSSKKFICPQCGKKTLVLYRDQDGNYAPENFGRCDRENNCGYFSKPEKEMVIVEPKQYREKAIQYIDFEDAVATACDFMDNNLIKFLVSKIGMEATDRIIQEYRIGIDHTFPSTRDWIIWWQFDINGRCRSGKLMRYNPDGRRDKSQSATWYHKINLKYTYFEATQCYFGEHLIPEYPKRKIAVVESEKTACIASHFLPEYTWIASGSSTGLGYAKSKVLKHRDVTLFPDLGMYDTWKLKASEYGWNVSRMLEDIATDEQRSRGLDLADFLI